MIIDCIMFAYEPEALAIRLEELKDVVDYTIIVEGKQTFRGEPREVVSPAGLNVINVAIDLEGANAWEREKFQRDYTVQAARERFGDDAWAIVADADEIPHPREVARCIEPSTLSVDYREWFADWRAPDAWQPHNQPYMAPIGMIDSANDIRQRKPFPYATLRGWHLSSLGDGWLVNRKIGEFSHSEYDDDHWRNVERLNSMRDSRIDMFDRFHLEHTTDLPSCISLFPDSLGGSVYI